MIRWLQASRPKDERFCDLFERRAEILSAGAKTLRRLLDGGDGVTTEFAAEILRQEHAGSSSTRRLSRSVGSSAECDLFPPRSIL
jgi:hypothetical protein